MKTIRRLHLYLGCFFAPLLAVFAFTGVLQVYELHKSAKDGSYAAPRWVMAAANLHKHAALTKTGSSAVTRGLVAGMALALILTMVLGVALAFRSERNAWPVAGSLVLGVLVPLVLLFVSTPSGP